MIYAGVSYLIFDLIVLNKIISLKSRELFLSNHLIYILYENKAISTFPVCNKGRDLQMTL